ncbi:MAG: DUF1553 domain-containing protein, partial [Pirellulaceae bacterium]|nr:DUF1553 domain-containing protein [Pirellulaceae bacterium]
YSEPGAASGSINDKALGPIDAFVAQRLRTVELDLAEPASMQTLLRRVTFDVTGLPPSRAAIEALQQQADQPVQPDAYERLVDRLLASPLAGEHLAQSWLDLARYAETDGFEHDKVRSDAWRYRDWVIAAMNSDMAYDRFMRLQVAGDVTAGEVDGGLATTFCLAGPDMPDLNDQDERRHNLLNEMTGTVGSVLLGLQMGCAACHDHKYDPISQADFYRLRGILESGVPKLVRDKPWSRFQQQSAPPVVHLYQRGDHRQPGATLSPGVPRVLTRIDGPDTFVESKQPRAALADWLASPANPLPARAMANRLWQSHFGRGLAATTSDLGLIGIEPTHGALLDWLACELRDGEWSMQRLRRQILTSATYRARSFAPQPDLDHAQRIERDPDNRLLSRYPRRRLTGEMLRDAMLMVSGSLDQQSTGPSVMPPLPAELLSTLLPGQWKASPEPADHARRSIYIFARRNLRYPIFESFDRPDAGASCPERGRSVTATQSLLLFNSEFSLEIARHIAQRVLLEVSAESEPEELARALWQQVLGRLPADEECKLLEPLLERFDSCASGLTAAALGLLNSNEFITLD